MFFSAVQVTGLSLQPAFDSVQVLTSVLVNGDAVAKVIGPDTSLVFPMDSVTVEPEKLCTVAPDAIPVPVTVIPWVIPFGSATRMVFCPDNPLAEVTTAELPPKTTVPETAPEFVEESVTVVPETPVTLAPPETPMP